MALDPSIALNVRPIQVADPLAQYGQIAQLQNYQNQNALAQFQLGSAQRQEAAQNALSSAYQKAYNPDTGEVNNAMLVRSLAEGGAGHLIPEVQTKMLAMQKERGLVKKTALETSGLEFKQNIDKANKAIQDIASLNNSEDAIASIDRHLANGVIDQQKANMLKANLGSAPSFGAWQRGMLTNILDAKEKLTFTAPKPTATNLGGKIVFLDLNPNSPTFQTEVVPSQKVGMSPDAAARLAFDQSKLAYERANPGFELKETEDGSIVGVNKRTLQAFPVTVGGAPSAVAPAVGGGGIPTGRTAPVGQPTGAPAEGAPMAGTPLKGKGTALTESQGNATAFGMRMLESNKLLSDLEGKGTTSGGRIKGAIEGTLTSLVPYMGENLAQGAGAIINTLPSIAGGPSESQQMYQQAKTNFITAVLRKESGAAIGQNEFNTEDKKYFPQAGDTDKVIKQKQKARELAIEAMKIQAGPGAKSIKPSAESNAPSGLPNVSATNPLGLPGR